MACKRRAHLIRPSAEQLKQDAARAVWGRVQRLTPAGRWVPDDGVSPGLAFTAGVIAYYPGPDCNCYASFSERTRARCVSEMAMKHVTAHYPYGCANGREVTRYVPEKKVKKRG